MGNIGLPLRAIRSQIVAAVDLIVQIERQRDGKRRITQITDVLGMEGEIVTLNDVFRLDVEGEEGRQSGRAISRQPRAPELPRAARLLPARPQLVGGAGGGAGGMGRALALLLCGCAACLVGLAASAAAAAARAASHAGEGRAHPGGDRSARRRGGVGDFGGGRLDTGGSRPRSPLRPGSALGLRSGAPRDLSGAPASGAGVALLAAAFPGAAVTGSPVRSAGWRCRSRGSCSAAASRLVRGAPCEAALSCNFPTRWR